MKPTSCSLIASALLLAIPIEGNRIRRTSKEDRDLHGFEVVGNSSNQGLFSSMDGDFHSLNPEKTEISKVKNYINDERSIVVSSVVCN